MTCPDSTLIIARLAKVACAGIASVLLTGCPFGGHHGQATPAQATVPAARGEITVSGVATKGDLKTWIRCLFTPAATVPLNLVPSVGDTVQDVETTDTGQYSCKGPADTKIVVARVMPNQQSVSADEATGMDIPIPSSLQMSAAFDRTSSSASALTLHITAFSHAAVVAAQRLGPLTTESINRANSGVAGILGFDHLATTPITAINNAALNSASGDEKKFSTLNASLSSNAAMDTNGCGANATHGEAISCTVAQLADQFQLSVAGAGGTVMTLTDKGRAELYAGAERTAALYSSLGNKELALIDGVVTSAQSAGAQANAVVKRIQARETTLDYQVKLTGKDDIIRLGQIAFRYALLSDAIYEDTWANGASAGMVLQTIADTTKPAPAYSAPASYTVLDWQAFGIDANEATTYQLQWGILYSDVEKELVFVYRGTEPDLIADPTRAFDLAYGLASVACTNHQYSVAKAQFDRLVANPLFAARFLQPTNQYRIVLTGHSLGGGIASYVATFANSRNLVSRVFAFNPAPQCNEMLVAIGQFPPFSDPDRRIVQIQVEGQLLGLIAPEIAALATFVGQIYKYPSPYAYGMFNPVNLHKMGSVLFALDAARGLCQGCSSATNSGAGSVTPLTSLAVSPIQAIAVGVTPLRSFEPAVKVAGTGLLGISQITWECVQPSVKPCAGNPVVWTTATWGRKVDIKNSSTMTLYPALLPVGSDAGIYTWKVTFAAPGSSPVSQTLTVTLQPQPATGLLIERLSSPRFPGGARAISVATAPLAPALYLEGTNLAFVNRIDWKWTGAAAGSTAWIRGDANWSAKVVLDGAGKLTLTPVVIGEAPTWSGTALWTATLRTAAGDSRSFSFSVTYAPPRPAVTGVAPPRMAASSHPQSLTILGTSFSPGNMVQVRRGGAASTAAWSAALPVISSSAQQIVATLTPGAVADSISVRVCKSATLTADTDCSVSPVQVVVAVAAVTAPDLAPQSVQVAPDPSVAGSSVVVSYSVANLGGAAALASQTRVQVLDSSGAIFAQPQFATPAIAAGGSLAESRAISLAGAAAGTYTVYVMVDFTRVAGQTALGNDISAGKSFAVQAAPIALPTVSGINPTTMVASGTAQTLTIAGGSFSAGNVVQFKWGVGTGAGVWTSSAQAPTISATQITVPISTGAANDAIFVRVCRSSSAQAAADCSAGTQSVAIVATTAPTPLSPASGAVVTGLSPTLTWTGGANVGSLQINVSRSPYGAANIVYTSSWLPAATTSIVTTGLVAGVGYRWDITACSGLNGAGTCSTSSNSLFSTQAAVVAPTAPSPTAPVSEATVTGLSPVLAWAGGANFGSLQVSVSRSPYGASDIVYTSAWLSATATTAAPTGLLASTNYRWSVTACSGTSGAGVCVIGNTSQFSTAAPAPSIASLRPPSLVADGSQQLVTISGSNFSSGNIVQWNRGPGWTTGTGNGTPNSVSASQLTVYFSSTSVGTVNVRVCRSAAAVSAADCSSELQTISFAAPPQFPDLAAGQIYLQPQAYPWVVFAFGAIVNNVGSVASNASVTGFELYNSSGAVVLSQDAATPPIQSNSSTTLQWPIDMTTAPRGAYCVRFIADKNSTAGQSAGSRSNDVSSCTQFTW